jgi:hypothetical protein
MAGEDFPDVLRTLQRSAVPSSGHDLAGMEMDFFAYLQRPYEIDGNSLQVERTGDTDALIRANCVTRNGAALEQAVEAARRVWAEDLRYGYLEANEVSVLTDRAELRSSRRSQRMAST